MVASFLTVIITGCGSSISHNRREFSAAELQLAKSDPECVENRSDWECNPATPLEIPSPVASMSIEPDRIQAVNGGSFTAVAHLYDADGNPIPGSSSTGRSDIPVVKWSGDGLSFDVSSYGHEVRITVDVPVGSGPVDLIIKATVPGSVPDGDWVAVATANVSVAEPAGQGDRMVDRFAEGSAVNVGLYNRSAGDCSLNQVALYTEWAPLEELPAACQGPSNPVQSLSSVVFFSPDQRFKHIDENWTKTPVTVMRGVASPGDLPAEQPVFIIPLRVWRGVTSHETDTGEAENVFLDDVMSRAREYGEIADSVLRRNRAGLLVHVSDSIDAGTDFKVDPGEDEIVIPSTGGPPVPPSPDNYCRYIAAHVATGSFGETPLPAVPGQLEIVFVHTAQYRAYACPDHDVILLHYGSVVPTTLAHEIGHKLALNGDLGHTTYWWNQEQGFTTRNVMWTFESDEVLAARDHVSLGQVFRMNRHKSSLASMPPYDQPSVDCGEDMDDAAGNDSCPCLGLDVEKACEAP
jgi:hypothetical protein